MSKVTIGDDWIARLGPPRPLHFAQADEARDRGNKAAKMDIEACVVLPDGRLLAIGSGSTPARGFTDATALPDGRVVFLAGAEDSPDTYRDGDVLGARIGLLAGDRVILCEILDKAGRPTSLELEGVEFVGFSSSGGVELAVVADMDDPDVPAVIASLRWGPP